MKIWFKTLEEQILDLNTMNSFWVEDVDDGKIYRVMCKAYDQIEWTIAYLDNDKQASDYLKKIYVKLTGEVHEPF